VYNNREKVSQTAGLRIASSFQILQVLSLEPVVLQKEKCDVKTIFRNQKTSSLLLKKK